MSKLLVPLCTIICMVSAFRPNHPYAPVQTAIQDTLPSVDEKIDIDTNMVFTRVEVEPKFVGGDMGRRKFLQKNLNVAIAYDNKAPKGSYTTVLQFIVEKDGSLTEIKALTTHGYGIEQEAVRAMKNSPKWEPGMQNGRVVRSYHKMPITFVVY